MRLHLAAAAADFLAETHLWREAIEQEATVVGQADYELFGSAVIESVLWLTLDATTLDATDPRLLDKAQLSYTGKPQRYWVVDDTIIRLHPIPDAVYTLSGTVALKPARTATGVPSWLYETWADALVDGAIWRISRIPGKSWTSMELAALAKQRFDRAKANAKTRDLRQIELRVQPVSF
jgi:hypothetical protein